MKTKKTFFGIWIISLVAFLAMPAWVFAQNQPAAQTFSEEELAQMLAPIALYPDSLLAQILMAATYPLEVVQADRWVKANQHLSPDQINDALDQKNWDPSVKALVPFPQVLSMMSDKLEWTESLGDAFLAQEDQVMDTVQQLRARAQAAGNLRNSDQERVVVQDRVIVIEPAYPDVVFVPVYDPFVVYGPWWYPAYPPFSFFIPPPPGVIIVSRVCWFRPRILVSPFWVHGWGYWDWPHRSVYVNVNRTINVNRHVDIHQTRIESTPWRHDVIHRKGVPYRNESTWKRYGNMPKGSENRRQFRGFKSEMKYPQGPVGTPRGFPEKKYGNGSKTVQKDFGKTKTDQAPESTYKGAGQVGQYKGPDTQYQPKANHKDFEKTKTGQTPESTYKGTGQFGQYKGTGTQYQPKADYGKNKNVFGSWGQGKDVRIQSNRGYESRQQMGQTGAGNTDHSSTGQNPAGRGGRTNHGPKK